MLLTIKIRVGLPPRERMLAAISIIERATIFI